MENRKYRPTRRTHDQAHPSVDARIASDRGRRIAGFRIGALRRPALVRGVYADAFGYAGLAWNLFLAWLPMIAALTAYNLKRSDTRGVWVLIVPCVFLWLLFFPNAPYILTDLLHLRARDGVPLWYDLILLIVFAWTGTFLGLVSLYLMHLLVRRAAGATAGGYSP